MAQQQEITYQYDLFIQTGAEVIRPFVNSEAVSGVVSARALQVKETGEQTRALTLDLMGAILSHSNSAYKQVKQNKGVAGIDQMPVGEFAAWYAENGEILIDRFKEKVRRITKRNRGVKFEQTISELIPLLRGWLNYFQYARCKSLLMNLDS
jgi:hypothetical protein